MAFILYGPGYCGCNQPGRIGLTVVAVEACLSACSAVQPSWLSDTDVDRLAEVRVWPGVCLHRCDGAVQACVSGFTCLNGVLVQ